MVESLILGSRDVIRNKRIFIIFEITLLLTCMIAISASSSLFRELNNASNVEESLIRNAIVPVSNDMSANVQLVNKVNRLLKKAGKSFFYSDKMTNQLGFPSIIVIDKAISESVDGGQDVAKLFVSLDIRGKIHLENSDLSESVTIEGADIGIFDERIFELYPMEDMIIILLNTNELVNWIETKDGLEIFELVENLGFDESDNKGLIDEFETALEGSFLVLQQNNYQSEEVKFILFFVYPFVVFIIMSLVVAFVIMYDSLFKKLYREYTIHLISGATLKHIFARNSVFIITLISVCFLFILILNGFQINLILWITLVVLSLVLIVFEILLYLLMKRGNLSMILRGDY